MKAIVFQDGKPTKINVELNTNQEMTLFLNELASKGYISGFIMPMNKEGEE